MCHYGNVTLALNFKKCKNAEMSLNLKLKIIITFMS